ncbi:hypothetical protein POM88_031968 [Heracleum sosnowskyi]|uniref:Uncharacterized protein n=1 Tax=Heracleum sosnowskyi TaxID=360622 RepID=A0AAD8I1B5_9APIA|nr:hypothetical protein POM88_031968 [Heracleum sosnowskyi]
MSSSQTCTPAFPPMSFFSVRRLLSARKSWRVFAKKIKTNLHKLHMSKVIKKPKTKNRLKAKTKPAFWPALSSFPYYRQRGRGTSRVRRVWSDNRYRLQKRIPPPVYIDQLFVNKEESSRATSDNQIQKISPHTGKTKLIDEQVSAESVTSSWQDNVKERKKIPNGDDMWESLVLASPQMYGINERAEEFIARFRAEMRKQEKSASHL